MKGVDGGYTLEAGVTLDQRTRGMGGLKSSCGEENLLNIDEDPCYNGRDILTHEFAHAIMDYGLPPEAVAAIRHTHAASVASGLWKRPDGTFAYAASNASEYWAELSMWYFGTHGEFLDQGARQPAPGPAGLARYDPAGFNLLGSLYDGTHAAYAQAVLQPPSRKLEPLPASAPPSLLVSLSGDAADSVLVLRNGSGSDAVLNWVDSSGACHPYGTVPALGVAVQHTYAGHVWQLAPMFNAGVSVSVGAPPVRVLPPPLFICAEEGTCVVELWAEGGKMAASQSRKRGGRRRRGRGRGGNPRGGSGDAAVAEGAVVSESEEGVTEENCADDAAADYSRARI
mmetsp:Transcript_28232/g.66266  ORF Transcript_28232/g.66266 Transcript_28232/m.66266 type:complete len:341 (-) Transcript_28232:58-1080(-)